MVSNEGLKGLEWKVVLSTISDWEDWVGNVGDQKLAVRAFDQVDLDQLRTTKEYFNDTIMVSLRDSVRTGCGKVVVSLFRRGT